MERLDAWLRSVGLAEHAPAFRTHRVAPEHVAELTEDELRELGLTIGDRRRLRAALAKDGRSLLGAMAGAAAEAPVSGHPASAVPERRPLTVVFVDLVDSTALTAQLEPEDLLEVLRSYRGACSGAILRFGGHVARFVGDGILAYFCYPAANEDDPERAVRASLEAVAAVRGLTAPGRGTLEARVGIATGLVMIGDLFAAASVDPGAAEAGSALGNAPNLAARLQALAPPGGVVVAAETAAKLGGRFSLEDLGPQTLKGFAAPERAFRVSGERRRALRPHRRGGQHPPTVFVGREAETALLYACWAEAVAGRGAAVLLRGEAGIGKSRLVRRFLLARRVHGAGTALIAFASPFHGDSPLHPVVAALRALARIGREETAPEALRRLRPLLTAGASGGAAEPEAETELAALAELLGVPGADEPLRGLLPQKLKALMLETVARQIVRLATAKPLCLVVEDAHWLDPTTLELLERVLAEVPGRRILLLITAREAFSPPEAALRAGLVTLDLNGLAEADVNRLVDALCGADALPPVVREDIVRRTGGVPLFVEELAHVVAGCDGRPAIGAAGAGAVPVSLQECLAARLDRSGAAKAVAQSAAVLGTVVRTDQLAAVSGLEAEALRDALARLDAARVLQRREDAAEGEVWAFRHALLRDAAYEGLLRVRRRALHGRAADALLAAQPPGARDAPAVPTQPEILAHHLCEAGREAESVPHWAAAARRSLARSALQEATRLLRRGLAALDALPDEPATHKRRLELMVLLGPALINLCGPGSPEAQAHYAEAVELCRRLPDCAEYFPIHWGWWRLSRDYRDHRERAAALYAHARSRRDRGLRLQAHHCNWATHFNIGDLCGCERHIRAGLRIYTEETDRDHTSLYGHDAKVCAHAERSLSLWQRGLAASALAEEGRAGAWARHLGHVGSLVHAQDFATMLRVYHRDTAAVQASADRLAALAAEHGFDDHRARCLVFRGWAAAMGGEAPIGARMAREGLATEREVNTAEDFPIFSCLVAEAVAEAGDPGRALEELTTARQEFERIGLRVWMPEIWRTVGDLASRLGPGSAEDAAAAYDAAVRVAEEQGAHRLALRAALGGVRFALRRGAGGAAQAARLASALMRIPERDGSADERDAAGLAARLGPPPRSFIPRPAAGAAPPPRPSAARRTGRGRAVGSADR